MRAEGKHPYTKRTPTRCRGHSRRGRAATCYADRQEAPRPRIICRVVVYARRNPARMNRHIISEFERVAPKCSLICGKMRGACPNRGTLYEFAPLPLRGVFARTTRRQPSARSAENPSAAWKPINSPDSGKHPMRKTITAVARDAAIWCEHKRRQRSGEQDERRDIEMGGSVFHLALPNDGKRGVSPSRAEKRLLARRYAHTRRMKPRIERQLGAGFFPSKRRLGPKVFRLGAEKAHPSKRRRKTMSRKPRYASFAPALGPGAQVKSSSTCTSTPPFAVMGAPIAAKQPSTHAFNSSNCSPSLM